jgi:hypothetical protein
MSWLWKAVKAFGRFWYGFIIGDDWAGAAGVVVLIAGTWLLLDVVDVRAFWFGPVAIGATAVIVVARGLRRSVSRGPI